MPAGDAAGARLERGNDMVRLKDIATRAGVSVMTISKVLRDAPDISAATKARVRKLADEMGYMPDVMAQSLRSRRSRLFGLVIPAATNPIFARIVMAIEEHAHLLGFDLLVAHSLNEPAREERVVRRMLARRVDGLFLSPVYRLDPVAAIYEELIARRTPTVLLGQRAPFCSRFANVESDDMPASFAATQHLLSLGHRRIAFFTGPAAAPSSQDRIEGYRRALREAQIDWDDTLVFPSGNTIEEGQQTVRQMLTEAPGATAIQAAHDLVAIGAANHLLEQGLRIPTDYSIVGFGNILSAEVFRVPLTTVRQPKHRLGVAAMQIMERLMRGEAAESQRLPAELLVRQSTAPPSSR